MDSEQAEQRDRLSESLRPPESALIRDAVHKRFAGSIRELAEEAASEPARPEDPGSGHR